MRAIARQDLQYRHSFDVAEQLTPLRDVPGVGFNKEDMANRKGRTHRLGVTLSFGSGAVYDRGAGPVRESFCRWKPRRARALMIVVSDDGEHRFTCMSAKLC